MDVYHYLESSSRIISHLSLLFIVIEGEHGTSIMFNDAELLVMLLAWTDEAYRAVYKKLVTIQADLDTFKYIGTAERAGVTHRLKHSLDLLNQSNASISAYIASPRNLDHLINSFTLVRQSLVIANDIEEDETIGHRKHVYTEQSLIVYAPYWIPILVPLLRFRARV